jgi:hypothetical protein
MFRFSIEEHIFKVLDRDSIFGNFIVDVHFHCATEAPRITTEYFTVSGIEGIWE